MGKIYLKTGDKATELSARYNVTGLYPMDTRLFVDTFSDLLNARTTFNESVHEGMKVEVMDEGNVYELISQPNKPDNERYSLIKKQFDYTNQNDYSINKRLWKRLTIETITTKEALQRAKDNLVNGALIYIAKDITLDDGTTQKSGFYFCQNVNGEGVLTLAGGSEIVNNLNTNSTSAALSAAMGKALNDSINGLNDNINDIKELREMSIDFGNYEDSVTIAIMQPSIISSVKLVNVSKLLLSYDGQVQQEYTGGEVDLGNSDYLVLEVTRGTDATTAVVGLTLKNK